MRAVRLLASGLAGLAVVYLAGLAVVALTARPKPGALIVVLGNALRRDHTPSRRLQARLDAAYDVWKAGLAPRILVSGGVERDGSDEAASMAAYLQGRGVPSAAITQDPAGVDTFETARKAAALAGPDAPVIAVSQWFHLPRTMLALHRFGFRHVSASAPRYTEWRDAWSFLREAVGLPYYAVVPLSTHRSHYWVGRGAPPASAAPAEPLGTRR